MQTNLFLYLLYALCTAGILYVFPTKYKAYFLLFTNIVFYALCDLRFLGLLLFSMGWTYFISFQLTSHHSHRKCWLLASLVPVVLILCFFKYFHFFVPTGTLTALSLLMPLGLSYYTFKLISYSCDIYLQKSEPEHNFAAFALYITFFPQITCGPISHSKEITTWFHTLSKPDNTMLSSGFYLILSGLFKKMVIADRLSGYVNTIFSSPDSYPSLALWMAAFFYSIQLYCDFAGYSEIAIGLGNLMGIPCAVNFDKPYFSYNVKEFWRRWHISLSSWLRDYIYIPLGGNNGTHFQKNIRVLITFAVSGLWHGNSLNFLFWGIWHGFWNIISPKKSTCKFLFCIQILLTDLVVMFGWIFFRSQTLPAAFQFIRHMFDSFSLSMDLIIQSVLPFTGDYACAAYLLTVCLFIFILFLMEYREYKHGEKQLFRPGYAFFFLGSILLFGVIGQNSFLYANF